MVGRGFDPQPGQKGISIFYIIAYITGWMNGPSKINKKVEK